jgi:hypothetical protein
MPADYFALNIFVHIIKGANVRKKAKEKAEEKDFKLLFLIMPDWPIFTCIILENPEQ